MKRLSLLILLSVICILNANSTLKLETSIPKNGASGVSVSSKIVLTFNESITSGTNTCKINGNDISFTAVSKYAIFTLPALDYLTEYTLTIPEGAILNNTGESLAPATIKFTTMPRPQPDAKLFDAIVAKDGSGNYTSVQKAIDNAPENFEKPWLIFIKNGIYNEVIRIPENKPYIHLIGEDKEKTIIEYKINCASSSSDLGWDYSCNKLGIEDGCVIVIKSDDFFTENISYINTYGYEAQNGPQALAVRTKGDRAVFNNCKLISYQDTWMTTTDDDYRLYVKDCWIEGAVDFIYCGGNCYFDSCTINVVRTSGGYIVAPSHGSGCDWGYIFMNCTLTAPQTTEVYFGRPWHNSPKASFVNSRLGKNLSIYPVGWQEKMGAIPAIFADYNTVDYLGNQVDTSKRISSYWYYDDDGNVIRGEAQKSLTAEEVASYTIPNVLRGDDQWRPEDMVEKTGTPVLTSKDGKLQWDKIPYAICYAILKNDSVIDFTEDTYYENITETDAYNIRAVNEFGGLSKTSNTLNLSGITNAGTKNICASRYKNTIYIKNIEDPAKVLIYSLNGILLKSSQIISNAEIHLQTSERIIIKIASSKKTICSIL